MSREELATWVGIVATAVTFVQIVPQIVRLLRTGRTEGVSPVWAAVGMTINLGWLTYVVEQKFWVTIPSIVAAVVSFAVALYLLYRNGADLRAGLLMSAAVAVASVGIQMGAGWTVLGTVLGLSNGAVSRTLGDRGVALARPGRGVPRDVVADRAGGPEVGLLRRAGVLGADRRVRVDRGPPGGSGAAAPVDSPPPRPGRARFHSLSVSGPSIGGLTIGEERQRGAPGLPGSASVVPPDGR